MSVIMVFFNIKIKKILPSLHFRFQNFPVYFSKWNCQFFKSPIRILGGIMLFRLIYRELSFYTMLLPNPIHLKFCSWHPVVFVSVFFKWFLHISLKFIHRFKKKIMLLLWMKSFLPIYFLTEYNLHKRKTGSLINPLFNLLLLIF